MTLTGAAFRALDATAIGEAVRGGRLTAAEVVRASIAQIEVNNPRWNAVVKQRFDAALDEARAADARQLRRPLEGVPITVKECYDVAGLPTTLGLGSRKHHHAATTDLLVSRLMRAGAIVVGKTNVSQLLIYPESDNPVYGRTTNPWNEARTPGGSSGGEAAIIAAECVPAGLGGDFLGSLRIPAHFCGIHALRPTAGRLTAVGQTVRSNGQQAVMEQAGPMARTVRDLALLYSVLCQAEGDPLPPPLDASASIPPAAGLRVGTFSSNGICAPSPAVERVVREAAAALARAAGAAPHVEFPMPAADALAAATGATGLTMADGGAFYRGTLACSAQDARTRGLLFLARWPRWILHGLAALLHAVGQGSLGNQLRFLPGPSSTGVYWAAVRARDEWRRGFLAKMDELGVDVVVCPAFATPALLHGQTKWAGSAATYSLLPSYLGFPCGVVAAGRVLSGEESMRPPSGDLVERALSRTEAGSEGLPVGVQVIGRPWREDQVLAAMSALEAHFRAQPDYPKFPST